MTNPELRLITGEDSPMKRFKSFVTAHSEESYEPSEMASRFGEYIFQDETQVLAFDRVEFEVEQEPDEHDFIYSIRFIDSRTDESVYEMTYYDGPSRPTKDNKASRVSQEEEADRLVILLTKAERLSKLFKLVY